MWFLFHHYILCSGSSSWKFPLLWNVEAPRVGTVRSVAVLDGNWRQEAPGQKTSRRGTTS